LAHTRFPEDGSTGKRALSIRDCRAPGYGSTTPESTFAALRRAIAERVQIAEVDDRLAAGNIPVIFNDENLSKTAGIPHRVSKMTLAEVENAAAYY
jgi:glycerophosphoryl diester phosphodiesterase